MKPLIFALLALVAVAAGWAAWVFSRPEPAFGPGGTPVSLSADEVRVLAMDRLQDGVSAEMRFFVAEGRFTEDLAELGNPAGFVADDGVGGQGQTALEVCGKDRIAVLATVAADGAVFAVKARGLEPHPDGNAEFSYYTADAPCDETRGPERWPGGYEVSRGGLLKGGKKADVPLS